MSGVVNTVENSPLYLPITESTKNILDDFKLEAKNINIEVWYVIAK